MPLTPPYDTVGLDLHKRETQLCTLAADGGVAERRIATTRPQFTAALGDRPPARRRQPAPSDRYVRVDRQHTPEELARLMIEGPADDLAQALFRLLPRPRVRVGHRLPPSLDELPAGWTSVPAS